MRLLLAGIVAGGLACAAAAQAQTTVTGNPADPGKTSAGSGGQSAVTRPNTDAAAPGNPAPGASQANLEPGANSFTEGQVRSRLEQAGFKDVSELKKDDQGIWRGKASRDGKSVAVGFDFKGNVRAE